MPPNRSSGEKPATPAGPRVVLGPLFQVVENSKGSANLLEALSRAGLLAPVRVVFQGELAGRAGSGIERPLIQLLVADVRKGTVARPLRRPLVTIELRVITQLA
jgi:hypothetical protein